MNDIFSSEGLLNKIFTMLADSLWTYLLLALLVGCGIYFTIRTRFFQFRMLGEMFRSLGGSFSKSEKGTKISSFQAFIVSIATRVGTGNLVGVSTAIVIGGPGSIFWMWIIAIVGAASSFVESTLAQLYKRKAKEAYIGGPAYYIRHGLHNKWLAAIFAVMIILSFGMAQNSVQSNAICGAMREAFGFDTLVVGLIVATLTLFIVFGGIHRIAKISSVIVPIMAVGYFILAMVVVIKNFDLIPHVFKVIIDNAFGIGQFSGGAIGMALMMGVRRGLFSNEAGEGSTPNVAATADVPHPVKQGLVQSLGVFTDTLLVCSCTAFIILISGLYTDVEMSGIVLTQNALEKEIGWGGNLYVALAILFFAFSSLIGNNYYVEANVRYLTDKKWVLSVVRIFTAGIFVIFGAVSSLDVVWSLGDLFMGLLTLCNLVAIISLGKHAFRLLDDYRSQKRKGIKEPVFKRDMFKDLVDDIDAWN